MKINKFIAALLIALSFNGCAVRSDKVVKEPVEQDMASVSSDQKVMAFSLSGYEKNGRKKWEVQGKSADIMSEVVNLTDVVAKAYGEEIDMTLTADKGVFNRNTSDAHFESNVVVSGTDGTKMTTDEADWKNTDQKIVTDKPVKLYAEMKETSGDGTEKKIPTTIVCDGPMEINYGKNYAVFNTNVRVDDERGQIFCDTATAYYDSNTKKVSRIVARGNVKIVRGGSWTFSDEAVYLAAEQKVILSGSPKVIIYPEESKAAKKEGI
jgi:LPS export ABC transporter protein LptC